MTREPGDRPEQVIHPACGARARGGLFAAVTELKLSGGWRGGRGDAFDLDFSQRFIKK
jgi:hypothetical protein